MKTKQELVDCIYEDGKSILTRKTPVALVKKIYDGDIARIDAWSMLRMIHAGEENCQLPQYGVLTVYSLTKDNDEFARLYDQGIQLLIDNEVVDMNNLESDFKAEKALEKKKKSGKKKNINPRFN